MNTLAQDIRYAVRMLARSPGFAAVAVLTLALGIGANTAIFTVVNSVLLRPLAYAEPDRLVYVYSELPAAGFDKYWLSQAEFRELQANVHAFSEVAAWQTSENANVAGVEAPIRTTSGTATAELFDVLGVPPALGRVFTRQEGLDQEPVTVVSHGLWQNLLGGDPAAVGTQLEVNGINRTVVGVMPPGFDIADAGVEVWIPHSVAMHPEGMPARGAHNLNVVGRLAPGMTLDRARAELDALLARWGEIAGGDHAPDAENHAVRLVSLHEEMVGEARPMLLLLLGVVGFVLLIACANVGNLLLARAEARQKEVAIRSAMGAGRGRLTRQFLTEALVLALAGGVIGLLLAYWGLQVLLAMSPGDIPRLTEIGLDPVVLAFTLGVTVITGALFGLAPLLHLAPRQMSVTLKEGGQRSTAGAGRKRLRHVLVISQIAAAVVLVIGSGLMLRSFAALQEVDPGFRAEGLTTFNLSLSSANYPQPDDRRAFYARALERLEAIPGVHQATAMSGLPPVREVMAGSFSLPDRAPDPEGPGYSRIWDYVQLVFANYFETMGIPVVEGRAFTPGDDTQSPPVVMVNERFANQFFPGESPVGQKIQPSGMPMAFTIVGVVRDVKQGGLGEEVGTEIYWHYPQFPPAPMTLNLILRAEQDADALAGPIRDAIAGLDPALPVARLQSMRENLAGSLRGPRFLTLLLGLFAGVALVLAAVGTFAVLSYSVAQQTREIGVRMALGARGSVVSGLVLRQGSILAGIGLLAGLAAAFALTRAMSGMLFGVERTDPLTFAVAPVVLGVVALLAAYLPARRATRVDPMVALRAE
jgi:putative ABC transport system permease protein